MLTITHMEDLSKVPPEFCNEVWALRDALYRKALSLTKSPADAEDLVADSVLKALRAWESFKEGSNHQAWLFTILFNTFLNSYARRKRYEDRLDRWSREPKPEPVEMLPVGPELVAAVSELPADYLDVFELVCVQDLSHTEAARRLGIPVGTSLSRLYRARERLRERLQDYAGSEYGIGLNA